MNGLLRDVRGIYGPLLALLAFGLFAWPLRCVGFVVRRIGGKIVGAGAWIEYAGMKLGWRLERHMEGE